MEFLEKNPLAKYSYTQIFKGTNGECLYEYHVALNPALEDYVTEMNKVHGGDLSLVIDGRPIKEVGQDEAIYYQYALSAMEWSGPNGETTPRPKTDGEGIMVSAFIGPSIGFGYSTSISTKALLQINHIRTYIRSQYLDEPSAMEVNGSLANQVFVDD